MQIEKSKIIYDCVFIGTSPIVICEAAYQGSLGKLVLMIDESVGIGGSWRPLKLFGLHRVENAVHYLLDNSKAFLFMKTTLKIRVIHSKKKYRVFPNFFGTYKIFHYDSVISRFLSAYLTHIRKSGKVASIYNSLILILKAPIKKSKYLEGGCAEMIIALKKLIFHYNIKIFLSTKIIKYHFDTTKNIITLHTHSLKKNKNSIVTAKKIFISHGSKISHIFSTSGKITLKQKIHLRPSLHLLINDNSADSIHELIFTNHRLIKYVHDISEYTEETSTLKGKKKILVIALQHNIKFYNGLLNDVLCELKKSFIISDEAFIESSYWQDIFLPALHDSDLRMLKRKFSALLECLYTDDITKGIAYNSVRWSKALNNF